MADRQDFLARAAIFSESMPISRVEAMAGLSQGYVIPRAKAIAIAHKRASPSKAPPAFSHDCTEAFSTGLGLRCALFGASFPFSP